MKNKASKKDLDQSVRNVNVGGRLIDDDGPKTCTSCGGQRGWTVSGGVTVHTGCGARQ